MVAKAEGAIVVTGNTGALRGVPSFVCFSPTKASQRILAECLARELGPQGVHVAYLVIDAMIDMPVADSATIRTNFFPNPPISWPKFSTSPISRARPAPIWWKSGHSGRNGNQSACLRPEPLSGVLR